jgi:hypothetical protein
VKQDRGHQAAAHPAQLARDHAEQNGTGRDNDAGAQMDNPEKRGDENDREMDGPKASPLILSSFPTQANSLRRWKPSI